MIKEIHNATQIARTNRSSASSTAKDIVGSFGEMFDQVNKAQIQADRKIEGLVTGQNKDIPGTMIAMEKADTSMKMVMAVRNKVVSAYEEMMRMQV